MTAAPSGRQLAFVVFAAAAAATAAWGCRGATQIKVDIHTDVPCSNPAAWKGAAVYAGSPGLDVESRAPLLITASCDATGQVGSVVLVPSGADDEAVGVRVVAGVTRPPEECAAHGYDGCIVARRTAAFLPHTSVELDIALTGSCVGRPCDPLRTCLDGVCQDARLTTSADPDAAAASVSSVRCGDDGVTCPVATGNGPNGPVCCLEIAGMATHGRCIARELCPATSTVLDCDDQADCAANVAADGTPTTCCLSYTSGALAGPFSPNQVTLAACRAHKECVIYSGDNSFGGGFGLCQNRRDCGSEPCTGGDDAWLPGYFWCKLRGGP